MIATLVAALATAHAAPPVGRLGPLRAAPPPLLTVQSGLSTMAGDGSAGGAGLGRFVFNLGWLGVEVGGREGLVSEDLRFVGNVHGGVRVWGPGGIHLRLAFTHNHEVPWGVAEADPVGSSLGYADGIVHRTGGELGLGWGRGFWRGPRGPRVGAWADLTLQGFLDDGGPPAYVLLEVGGAFHLGPVLVPRG